MVVSLVHSNLKWGSFDRLLLLGFRGPSGLFDKQIIVAGIAKVAVAVEEVA